MLTIFQPSSILLNENVQVPPLSVSVDGCVLRARHVTVADSPLREISQEPNAKGVQRLYDVEKRSIPCRMISSSLARACAASGVAALTVDLGSTF
jgi:hypothetical protein